MPNNRLYLMKNKDIDILEYKQKLKLHLLDICPTVVPDELKILTDKFTLKKFKKKDLLIEAGSFSDKFYFIVSGLVRIYYFKEDKEITNALVKENEIVAGAYSIITGEKNFNNYEALENTITLCIEYHELENLYVKYHSLEHLGRLLVQKYYSNFMKKTHDIIFLSAEERYANFIRNHTELLSRVPLRFIASYLGIAQETLSRLRTKEINKN